MAHSIRAYFYGMAFFLGLVILILVGSAVIYTPEYVLRIIRWGDSDVYDYQKFPQRPLAASDTPFKFGSNLKQDEIRARFEKISRTENFDRFLAKNHTQAFIVIQDDAILYEQYYNGAERDSIVTSFSTAKSFTSTLIGIAIAEGYINSVNDPITNYLPELIARDPTFKKITIRNLLMMASGIKYKEFPFANGDDAKTYYYPDLGNLALEYTQINDAPGEKFLYNNYHPLLLGLILERATGMSVTAYLQEKIWTPIGMEYAGSWSLDEHGFEKMESGINARAIDFAKFGRLMLHNGGWDGIQIIPEEWVAEATRADTTVDYKKYYYDDFIFTNGQGYYKYMWWGIQRDAQAYDFIAIGNHGQIIYISPEANLIILRFGESYGAYHDSKGWLDLFYNFATDIS